MTNKQLEDKVKSLEQRITVLENTRQIIYPYVQYYKYPNQQTYPHTGTPIWWNIPTS